MKVLFFARRYYPDIGGVEKHIAKISTQLIKNNHSITVIAEASQSDSPQVKKGKELVVAGVRIYKINVQRNDWYKKIRIWKSLWQLRHIINEADIIHCHDVFFWYLPFRFLFPRKPIFVTFHGYEQYPVTRKEIIVRKIAEKLSWGNICIGDFIAKWYRTIPTYVSYGGVTLPKQSISPHSHYSAVFIGRLEKNTGIEIYNAAFVRLLKRFPAFSMYAIGDGSFGPHLSRKIKRSGFTSNPEAYYLQNRFVFASGYLSILEAFAAQRLVFAVFDNPLKRDYLTMTPFHSYIIIVSTVDELVEKLTYYINHPNEEKKLVQLAYHWVNKQTWEKTNEGLCRFMV